jgi:hypothetical protein
MVAWIIEALVNMKLIQILLPTHDNAGQRLPQKLHQMVKSELAKKFGGITAYSRSPAEGQWNKRGSTQREEIIVYEVMVYRLVKSWWKEYRKMLEERFKQSRVVIRVQQLTII